MQRGEHHVHVHLHMHPRQRWICRKTMLTMKAKMTLTLMMPTLTILTTLMTLSTTTKSTLRRRRADTAHNACQRATRRRAKP
jgi:hypothetical protein